MWKYYKTKAYRQMESAENTIYTTLSKYVDLALVSESNTFKGMITELSKLNRLTPNEIKVTLMDFIVGGLFNVSNALNFVCYHLAKNPRTQQKLFEEINEVMNSDNNITVEKLSKMPFLKACIRESFRLTSIIPGIIRALPTDLYLSGYYIPKGLLRERELKVIINEITLVMFFLLRNTRFCKFHDNLSVGSILSRPKVFYT